MPDTPISFYVPARNVESTLKACIDAVRAQTRQPDELFILLDTRSTDGTETIARSLDVEIVKQRGNTLGAARNEAIQHASHPWLASCDADVMIEPDWLGSLAGSRESGAAGVGGATNERILDFCDGWRGLHMPHHWGDHPFRNPFMLVSEVMFDRHALLSVGGYRDDLNYYEDSDLCQRVREAGYDLFYQPAARATHLRHDNLVTLLNLRWQYSEYRQKHLMDRYAGLLRKTGVNREYAINTLSKSIARSHEELTYISFVLFFHHALMDLRSLMSRRPLLNASTRQECEHELVITLHHAIALHHPELAACVDRDLRKFMSTDTSRQAGTAPADVWYGYIQEITQRAEAFVRELGRETLAVVACSSRMIRGEIEANDVVRIHAGDDVVDQLSLLPLTSFVDESWLQAIHAVWSDVGRFVQIGTLNADEEAVIEHHHRDGKTVALCGHAEADVRPLDVFDHVAADVKRLIVCYRAPSRFVAGLDVLSASDLAAAATAAGWSIERFETLVGRTQLLLNR